MAKVMLWMAAPVMALGAMAGQAHQAGDWLVRVGAANIDPREDSGVIHVGGAELPTGDQAGVDDDTQLGLTITYMLADHLGLELLAASPFQHTISGRGPTMAALGVDKLAEIKHLPPTLSLQYYPLPATSAFQPYVGIGVNYTTFFSEDLSGAAKSALGASGLELDDSWGLAVQAGMDWRLDDHWLLNVSVWRLDIDTEASFDSALGPVKVDVDLDPWGTMLSVGYRF